MIEIEDDESVDCICETCNTVLLLGAEQEFGQRLSTSDPLIIHGTCTDCGQTYATIYKLDLQETEDMAEDALSPH